DDPMSPQTRPSNLLHRQPSALRPPPRRTDVRHTPPSAGAHAAGPPAVGFPDMTPDLPTEAPRRIPRRQVAAWSLWDWGSAGFDTVVITFIFSVYLTDSVGDGLCSYLAEGQDCTVATS